MNSMRSLGWKVRFERSDKMRTEKEIKERIKRLKEELEWAGDPKNPFADDPWIEVPRIQSQIDLLIWVLNEGR